jgi:hypothetical protein
LAIFLLAASGTGCFSTWEISRESLRKLDGYRAPGTRIVPSTEGKSVEFDEKSRLEIDNFSTLTTQTIGPFAAIDVYGSTLAGQSLNDLQEKPFKIDLSERTKLFARVKKYSHGKTAGLVVGLVLGAGVLVGGILAGLTAASLGAS